jgi:predicted sulfurtransferase
MKKNNLLLEIVSIVVVACLLGLAYNRFASPKKIPIIREEQVLTQASDSLVFAPSASSSATQQTTQPEQQIAVPTQSIAQTTQSAAQTPVIKDTLRSSKQIASTTKTEAPPPTANPSSITEKPKPAAVTYSQVLRLLEDKDVLFIDARNDDEWNEGHIPGAIHIFPEDFQKHIPEIISLPRDKRIVAYCSGGPECPLSHEICDQLANFGFKRLFIYFGGWTEWKKMKAEGK